MITLYREIVTQSIKYIVGYSGDTSGAAIAIPVKTTTSKPVKFPDTIFTYEGWWCDYIHKKAYRWKGTEREQIFYLDASLIDESNNIVSPEDWLATKGNKIVFAYYDSCQYCPADVKAKGNPSGHLDNCWLMSYQKADDTEVYLYEFAYDMRDNVVSQVSIEPRIHVDAAPGIGNILGEAADLSDIDLNIDGGNVNDDPANGGYDDSQDGVQSTSNIDDDTTLDDENYEP